MQLSVESVDEAQAAESNDALGATSAAGQRPGAAGDERSDLRKKNSENKALRGRLRQAELELEQFKAAQKAQEEEKAKAKGEFQRLYEEEKRARLTYEQQLTEQRLFRALERGLKGIKIRDGALEDVLALLPKDKIREKDGRFEGLEEVLEAFRKQKPYFFDEDGGSALRPELQLSARDKAFLRTVDPVDPWGVGVAPVGAYGGGYAPVQGAPGALTQEVIQEARRQGLKPAEWLEVLRNRQKRAEARAGRNRR